MERTDDVAVVHDLSKQYGTRWALDEVAFTVSQGEVFGLLGPNGAGKTTLLECLTGLRKPTSGTVRVLGEDPATPRSALRSMVAVQPQEATLFPQLSVRETVELWASFYPEPDDIDDVLARVGLLEEAHQRVKVLSGGQSRRLLLAVTVVGRPRVLLLDEPAAGLDPQAKEHLWDVVRQQRASGGTVLLSTHDMHEAAELCDRVAVLVEGRIAACDTPGRLVSELAALSTVTFTAPRETDLSAVASFPGVTAVDSTEVAGESVRVRVRTAVGDQTLKRIAGDESLVAADLDIDKGGLGDVFRSLAGDSAQRDGTAAQQKGGRS
ncbi:ABC transporter ATP-binding protein [Streptomyces iconiensis]|uniref:ABC transporter ATP-binding protein n=1 Tax=Streptomyces iconiensis TaxID=1384038 RepID=A0ABT6ZUQ5_9ACTN|nr:ABC transporter ATP-binding protein [Streptomyces iconiensis]MDJ1132788.1 ABC transporter ATP-binding protein [Streptomyces iconiensis]